MTTAQFTPEPGARIEIDGRLLEVADMAAMRVSDTFFVALFEVGSPDADGVEWWAIDDISSLLSSQ